MSQSDLLPIGLSADQLQAAMRASDPAAALARTIDEKIPADSVVGRIRIIAALALRRDFTWPAPAAQRFVTRVRELKSASRALAEWILKRPNLAQGADAVPTVFGEVTGSLSALASILIQDTRERVPQVPPKPLGIDRKRFFAEVYNKHYTEAVSGLATLIEGAPDGTVAGDVCSILMAAKEQQANIRFAEMYGPMAEFIREAIAKGPARALAEYVIMGTDYQSQAPRGKGYAWTIMNGGLNGRLDVLIDALRGMVDHPLLKPKNQ